MIAIRVTGDDVPLSTRVECLTGDCMNVVQSHLAAGHPEVIGLGPIWFATVYKGRNIGTKR